MDARVKISEEALEDAPVTLTVTMKLSEWRDLMRQIPSTGWPAWRFGALISAAIGAISQHAAIIVHGEDLPS